MFKVGNIEIDKALLLAPMEDVTDIAYRRLCKELGADVVYTEFVNSDGLIRKNKKTHKKLEIRENERPVGIQIYGGNLEPMVEAADINAGCWVKKVARRGAGAGLLLDPPYMQKMVSEIVKRVSKPVTVKTRIGWDQTNIMILEVAKRVEDAGAKALTIHCRTRADAHDGDPVWEWIEKVKEIVNIPVAVNGGIISAEDVPKAFDISKADAAMIARGAIQHPWIFREAKELMTTGFISKVVDHRERIHTAIKHLNYALEEKETRHAIIPFRKYWSGYLKGLHHASSIRQELMKYDTYEPIEEVLMNYLEELDKHKNSVEN